MRRIRRPVLWVLGVSMAFLLGMATQRVASGDDPFEQLKKLEQAFGTITQQYVEEVNAATLVEDAIEGMLKGLDPHSVYIDPDQMKSVREDFNAEFEGIGIYFDIIDDTLTVMQVIDDGPSEKVGLLAGDRIMEVDGETTVGFDNDDVRTHLKGPKGTSVNLNVLRAGVDRPLMFTIVRDEIPLYSVAASHMIDDRTGYVRLERFARTTYSEVAQAMRDLKQQGMTQFILDLRGNRGGYMEMAVRIVDELLPADKMIVYTKSRHASFNDTYKSTSRGMFEQNSVIVLVDKNSASASEIVAGAIQDHDRGLVVGQRTFGKGLVQRQFALNDGSVLQMTISKYYTPSGRLIQTEYEDGDQEAYYSAKMDTYVHDRAIDTRTIIEEAPDSLKFKTSQGRTVLGGGGILPDIIIPDSLGYPDPIVLSLIRNNVDDRFTGRWLNQHADFRDIWTDRDAFLSDFTPDESLWNDYWEFAKESGTELVNGSVDTSKENRSRFTRDEFEQSKFVIETRLKAHLARRLFDRDAFIKGLHKIDPTLQEAMRQWDQAALFARN